MSVINVVTKKRTSQLIQLVPCSLLQQQEAPKLSDRLGEKNNQLYKCKQVS